MMGEASRFEALEADITTLGVDAIVNAANAALMPGGGVDGAIRRKAGRALDDDLYAIGHLDEGEAVITPGYRLPASRVIHTVAPIWAGREDQKPILARCYENALALADTHQIRTIAFPAIGTGAYGWPADVAAAIAFDTVAAHAKACAIQTRIIFCCFSRADYERYAALIARLHPPL
jgi:O-acetyl-ADP-ribose deacetylase (regulator of RNase III)